MSEVAFPPAAKAHPQRTCVGCRARVAVAELIRLVVVDGLVVVDEHRTKSGRGAHLHLNQQCAELAISRKAFQRAFRASVNTDEVLASINQLSKSASHRANNGA